MLAEVAAQVDDVAGLGLTGQMHGSVFLDAAGEVIRPALLWNDQRTAAECDEITRARRGASGCCEIAGNPALTGFQAPKILWLRDARAGQLRAAWRASCCPRTTCACGSPASTRPRPRTPPARCCSTSRARDWGAEMLDALEIPREWLPTVYEGPQVTGGLRDDRRRRARAAGAGCRSRPAAATTRRRRSASASSARARCRRSIGTSGVVFAHRDAFSPDPSGPRPRVLPRRAGRLAPDGCRAVAGRLAELVARPGRRRLRHARRRGRGGRRRGPRAWTSSRTCRESARRTWTRTRAGRSSASRSATAAGT